MDHYTKTHLDRATKEYQDFVNPNPDTPCRAWAVSTVTYATDNNITYISYFTRLRNTLPLASDATIRQHISDAVGIEVANTHPTSLILNVYIVKLWRK